MLERLSPSAMLGAARERSGLLLDRATAAVLARIGAARRVAETTGDRLARPVVGRLSLVRAALDSQAAALAALGPQATLDRGYAIVRRAADATIVREPADAPAGTRLSLRVARGTVAARAEASTGADATMEDRDPPARPSGRTRRK